MKGGGSEIRRIRKMDKITLWISEKSTRNNIINYLPKTCNAHNTGYNYT